MVDIARQRAKWFFLLKVFVAVLLSCFQSVGDFCKVLKHEKVGPTFRSFKPCPFLPSVETTENSFDQYLNIVLNNKTGPLFW